MTFWALHLALSCSIEGFEGQPLTGAKSAVKSRLLAPWGRLSPMCASLGRESADDGDIVSSAINALGRLATSILLLALALVIPHICHRHHRRCLCKFFLPGVIFSRLNAKNWPFTV